MKSLDEILSEQPTDLPQPAAKPTPADDDQDYLCPICGGTGYLRQDVPVGHPQFGKLAKCTCRLRELEDKRLDRLRSISNMKLMERFTFDAFAPDGIGLTDERRRNLRFAYETCLDFANHPHGWLILLGGYGCGKTHLAAAIANHQIEQGNPALFVLVPDLLDHLRGTYSPTSNVTYDQRFEDIRTASLLILDDLGSHNTTPWAQEKLFQLFNYRYNAQLPTVVTTNHELEEIDRRIRSRIIDPDLSRIMTILAPDFRQSGVAQGISELSSLTLHADQTFETFDMRQHELDRDKAENLNRAYLFARNFAAHPKDWITFTGTYGCGKTHLAAAIANERVRSGEPALFVVVPDLLDHLRSTYSPNSLASYDKRFDEVRKSPLLVLDDLGTHSATPWAEEKLYQLFNYRYNARLPTVITMAKDVDLKPRLKSLILDVGRCTPFEILAPSYRGLPTRNQPKPTRRRAAPAHR
ncbi:MAG: Chromosomal replication initiator protein DnaA [Anaerolineae bacterium]|nr:Chromosomal replication initiator protein DnaA [Anaerolineae bacterium]